MNKEIEKIIDKFDFNRLHSRMKKAGRKWSFGGEFRLPTVVELKARATELLERAVQDNRSHWAGTFDVSYDQRTGKVKLGCEKILIPRDRRAVNRGRKN